MPADRGQEVRGAARFAASLPDAQLTRYADLLHRQRDRGGPADATGDLVDVTLTSPSYVFRDEVLTDASGAAAGAAAAEPDLHAGRRAARDGRAVVGAPTPTPRPTTSPQTVDKLLATPEARAKLMRFFIAWLEVKEPDEFTIAPSVFPEFTPGGRRGGGRGDRRRS